MNCAAGWRKDGDIGLNKTRLSFSSGHLAACHFSVIFLLKTVKCKVAK